jgi:phosphoadenosine phosphosulfate reductase
MPCTPPKAEIRRRKRKLAPVIEQIRINMLEKANHDLFCEYKVKQAREIIRIANQIFREDVAVAFSGGKDSLVALHLALEANPDTLVIFNSTTVEFPETIAYVKKLAKEWGFKLLIAKPRTSFFVEVKKRRWASNEYRWCCEVFKDRPAFELLRRHGIQAEITGTTRTESIYRRSLLPFKISNREPPIIRVNPIYDWNQQEVWKYLRERGLPRNPLYHMGYRRIGCWCCPLNGPSHYKRLRKTHPLLFKFLIEYHPPHPVINAHKSYIM